MEYYRRYVRQYILYRASALISIDGLPSASLYLGVNVSTIGVVGIDIERYPSEVIEQYILALESLCTENSL